MAVRWPIVVGIVAVGGGLAWLLLRGNDRDPAAPVAVTAPAPTPPVPALHPTPDPTPTPEVAPVLPRAVDDRLRPQLPDVVSPVDTFAQERRDDAWAVATEAEIAKRLEHLRGAALERTECRQTECRLVLAGEDPKELGKAIADLQGKHGLVGFASSLLLTAAEPRADGRLVLRAFATFER
jgi:hypothetical protein